MRSCRYNLLRANDAGYKLPKQTLPSRYILMLSRWGEFLPATPAMSAFQLYLASWANQGGMGDDLSHSPYVSGSFEALALRKVSNVTDLWVWSGWAIRDGGWCMPDAATYLWVRLHSRLRCPARRNPLHRQSACLLFFVDVASLFLRLGIISILLRELPVIVSTYVI